ncbi:hypothetical protein BJ508DRAFT_48517 [Ascobolus immersus RN42]|uniref:Uncharacterized protein n=1 Tax=Ascobolus immersus RN42 TaxID=1160509 RepID=A0A3N4HV83_ASCIM|nr:hypothetical protein BJ508DRAFT_48517 [Ascobolus immersus RN42]
MATTTKTAAKLDLSILSSSSEDETIVAATSRSGIERRTRHKRNTSSISLKDIQESGSLPSSRRRISPSLASASASQPTSASSRKSSGDNTVDLSNSRPNSTSTGPTRTSLELSPQKITRLRQDENRRRSSYGELSGANSSKPSISILTDSLSKTPKSPILLGSNIAPHSPSKFTSRSYGTNRGFESRRIRRNSRPSDIKPQGPASLKSQHRRSDTDHSPGFLSSGRYRRDASAAYSDYSNGEDELTPRPRKFNSHGKGILSASPDQLFPTFAPFHNYPTPSASSDEGSSYISPKNHSTNTPPPITHQPATPPPEASLRKQSVPSNIDVFAFMEVQSPMPVPTPLSAPMTEKPVLKKLDLVDVDLGFKEAPKDTKPESGSMSPVGSEGTLVDSPGRELPGKELPTRGLRGKDLSMKFVQSCKFITKPSVFSSDLLQSQVVSQVSQP